MSILKKVFGGQTGLVVLMPYAKADLDLYGSGVFSLSCPQDTYTICRVTLQII